MIRINLLPPEYRRRNRTPLKLMLALSGTVAVNALALTWLAWLHFGVSSEVDSERSVLQTEVDGLSNQVRYHKALEAERKLYAERESALAEITKNRISWTRKIDELIDVANRGGQGKRHLVWFDDLSVDQKSDPRTKSYGSVKAGGHSGSDNFAQVANFLEDLEGSAFASAFSPPAPPEGSQSQTDKELVPAIVWAFPLALALKSPEERNGEPPKPEPPAKAPAVPANASAQEQKP